MVKHWRRVAHERGGYTCRCCGTHEGLTLHHIEPISKNPELRMEQSNLVELCSSCHLRYHRDFMKDKTEECGLENLNEYLIWMGAEPINKEELGYEKNHEYIQTK